MVQSCSVLVSATLAGRGFPANTHIYNITNDGVRDMLLQQEEGTQCSALRCWIAQPSVTWVEEAMNCNRGAQTSCHKQYNNARHTAITLHTLCCNPGHSKMHARSHSKNHANWRYHAPLKMCLQRTYLRKYIYNRWGRAGAVRGSGCGAA